MFARAESKTSPKLVKSRSSDYNEDAATKETNNLN